VSQLSTEDRLEIAELVARYCWAIDQRRWDGFLDLFTDDCRLDFGDVMGVFEGRAGLERFTTVMTSLDLFMRHYTTNLLLEGDGSEALARSYVLAITGSGAGRHQATGRYEDRLVKLNGRWRIRERRAVIEMPA
jgi:ketosteroid isomerase-like protein